MGDLATRGANIYGAKTPRSPAAETSPASEPRLPPPQQSCARMSMGTGAAARGRHLDSNGRLSWILPEPDRERAPEGALSISAARRSRHIGTAASRLAKGLIAVGTTARTEHHGRVGEVLRRPARRLRSTPLRRRALRVVRLGCDRTCYVYGLPLDPNTGGLLGLVQEGKCRESWDEGSHIYTITTSRHKLANTSAFTFHVGASVYGASDGTADWRTRFPEPASAALRVRQWGLTGFEGGTSALLRSEHGARIADDAASVERSFVAPSARRSSRPQRAGRGRPPCGSWACVGGTEPGPAGHRQKSPRLFPAHLLLVGSRRSSFKRKLRGDATTTRLNRAFAGRRHRNETRDGSPDEGEAIARCWQDHRRDGGRDRFARRNERRSVRRRCRRTEQDRRAGLRGDRHRRTRREGRHARPQAVAVAPSSRVPTFQIVTVQGEALGPMELGSAGLADRQHDSSRRRPYVRVVGYIPSDDKEEFAIFVLAG